MFYLKTRRRLFVSLRVFVCVILCWCSLQSSFAQTDTEFWFAIPWVTPGHAGNGPNFFRLTSIGAAATVTLDVPSNPAFAPIVVNIPADGTRTLDVSAFINNLWVTPSNTALNRGVRIRSTSLITAYYEFRSTGNNPEIFSLKGANALGNEFTIVSQNFWYNNNYNPRPKNGFSIVATEDNTSITITPTKNMLGHPAGVPFTVTLNAGQTYACEASSNLAVDHLMGTKVSSDKPIAITVSDDSVKNDSYGNCADLIGDQMIPESLLGTEYLVMKGLLGSPDKVFVMAVVDGTQVFENGGAAAVATLNAGEMYVRDITVPVFFETSQPSYVYHVTGVTCEVGSAVLPPLKCTGSQKVGFTRSFPGDFGVIVMVQSGGEGNFKLDGTSGQIPFPASNFQVVPGTDWLVAQVNFTTAQINAGDAYLMTNRTHLFHLGVMDGPGGNSGGNYGYFSNFAVSSAAGTSNSPVSNPICEGDTLTLESINITKADYEWLGPDNFSSSEQTPQIPEADSKVHAGWYSVRVTVQGCPSEWDSVEVFIKALPIVDSVTLDTPCVGQPMQMNVYGTNLATFHWTFPDLSMQDGNQFQIPVTDFQDSLTHEIYPTLTGCTGDTFRFNPVIKPYPTPVISPIPELCDSTVHQVTLENHIDTNSYIWTITTADTVHLPDGVIELTTGGAGTINVQVEETQYGCATTANLEITVNAPPSANPPVFTCNSTNTGYTFQVTASGGNGVYSETTNVGSFSGNSFTSLEVTNDSSFHFVFDDSKGCGPIVIDSSHFCACTTKSGTMESIALEVCEGNMAVATHQNDHFLDGDDILLFVLHTSDTDTLGDILSWSTTPQFAFDQNLMDFEKVYYISAVAGNQLSSTAIDTSDRCLDVSMGVEVTFYDNPEATLIGGGVLCEGDTANFEVSISSPGEAEFEYSWNLGANNTSFVHEGDSTISTVLNQDQTFSSLNIKLTYGPECVGSVSGQADFTVHQYPNPVINKGDLEVCDGQIETYTVSTSGTFQLEWYDVNSNDLLTTGSSLTLNDNIDRQFYVIASTNGLCPSISDSVSLTFHTPPIATISGEGVICFGESATPIIEIESDTTSRLTINWGASNSVTLSTAGDTSVSDVIFGNTTFSLGAVAMDVFPFCPGTVSGSADYTVLPKPQPVIPEPDALLCSGEDYTLTVGPQPSGLGFEWIDVLSGETVSTSSVYTVDSDQDRSLTVIASYDGGNCLAQTDTVHVNYELIQVKANANPELIYFDENTVISAESEIAIGYQWEYDLGSSTSQSFTDSPNEQTVYHITVTGQKCTAEDWVEVNAIQPIIIPNGFSPNGDQENELWFIKGLEDYPNANLEVFNRWGTVVYENQGRYVEPWNGTSKNGEALPIATYYYVLDANDRRNQKFKGFVTILK